MNIFSQKQIFFFPKCFWSENNVIRQYFYPLAQVPLHLPLEASWIPYDSCQPAPAYLCLAALQHMYILSSKNIQLPELWRRLLRVKCNFLLSTRLFGSFLIVKSLVLILYELTQASSWKQRQIGWRFSPESAELPHSCNHLNQQFSFSSVLYMFPWHVNSWNVDATLSLKESFHKEPSNWENFLLQLKLLLQRLDPMLATTINKKRKLEALSSHCLLSSGGDQSTLSWLRVEAGGFTVWLVCLLLQVC